MLDKSVPIRMSEELYFIIKTQVAKHPDKFGSVNGFIRVAIVVYLRSLTKPKNNSIFTRGRK